MRNPKYKRLLVAMVWVKVDDKRHAEVRSLALENASTVDTNPDHRGAAEDIV